MIANLTCLGFREKNYPWIKGNENYFDVFFFPYIIFGFTKSVFLMTWKWLAVSLGFLC